MHPSDAKLQALIDGELGQAGSRRVLAHLESCETCRNRRQELVFGLEETADLLQALDRPPSGRTVDELIRVAEGRSLPEKSAGGGTLLRAASLAGLLIAGAVVAAVVPGSPLREVVERIVREPVAQDAGAPPAGDLWRREAGVALVPAGRLEVTFEALQSRGAVELVMTAEDTARVEVRSDSVGFVVGDGSVLVRNRGAGASYRIAVPSDLASARILIGSRTVFEVADGRIVRDEFRREGEGRRLSIAAAP